MDITIHSSFLPATDPEASLAFFRDALGFEVRLDVGQGTMRWLTIGPPTAHDVDVVQEPTDQPYGVRDCAFRDPAGNLVRIQQRP